MFAGAAALLIAMQAAPPPVIARVAVVAGECRFEVDGATLDQEALEARVADWGKQGREVHIVGLANVPYRCLGGAIFAMQKAGVGRIGFISEPADRIELIVPRGRCRVVVNGTEMAAGALRKALATWGDSDPEVHFQPDPKASFRCVDRVLGMLRDSGIPMRLGFIGNETVDPETPQ